MLNVKSSLKDNIAIQGVVKPGALTNILVNSARNEINGLSKKDMVVICGGTNDISTGCITGNGRFLNKYYSINLWCRIYLVSRNDTLLHAILGCLCAKNYVT